MYMCVGACFDILSVKRKLYDMLEMYRKNKATFKQTVINCCLVQLWHSFQGTHLPLADPTGHTSVQRCGPTRNCTSLGIMRCQLLAGITRLPCLTCHAPTTHYQPAHAWGWGKGRAYSLTNNDSCNFSPGQFLRWAAASQVTSARPLKRWLGKRMNKEGR